MAQDQFQFMDIARADPALLPLERRQREYNEIYREYSLSEAQQQAARCLDCGNPYCSWKCPLHNAIPRWLTLLVEGHIEQAAELSHASSCFPEICGRVCPQERLCEGACTLHDDFGAVSIGHLERFITEMALAKGWTPLAAQLAPPTGQKVAIVGAGPAGLACAIRLVEQGVTVRVFDQHLEIGGLLSFGLPGFKLDKGIILRRRSQLEAMGVEFELGMAIDENCFAALTEEYDALFVATGAQTPQDSDLANAHLPGVQQALPFLIRCNYQQIGKVHPEYPPVDLNGQRVVVLGGGDTAMDCARSAIRLGASEVYCVYRRDRYNMPGSQKEVSHAMEEDVHFIWQSQPVAILGDENGVSGVKLIRTELGEPDASGRQSVTLVKGSEETLAADQILISFGFKSTLPAYLQHSSVALSSSGGLQVGKGDYGLQTSNPKIFAGGDLVRGADLVVTAIADGQQAGDEMTRYLKHLREKACGSGEST